MSGSGPCPGSLVRVWFVFGFVSGFVSGFVFGFVSGFVFGFVSGLVSAFATGFVSEFVSASNLPGGAKNHMENLVRFISPPSPFLIIKKIPPPFLNIKKKSPFPNPPSFLTILR